MKLGCCFGFWSYPACFILRPHQGTAPSQLRSHLDWFLSHSTGCLGKETKRKKGRNCGKLSTFSLPCCICTVVAVYETAKMLLAQPTDSISNSEEMFFVWYAVNLVPVYLHNLQCSICGRKCDVI